jgi:esterase/lipase superfamily enzyme
MTPIQWINESFIVIDAWQNLGFAKAILSKFRGRWIVIFRRHEEGTKRYLLTRSEFDAEVDGKASEIRVEDALGLREHLASEVFTGRPPERSSRILKTLALNSPNRVVLVKASTGEVRAIGALQEAVGTTARRGAIVRKAAAKKAVKKAVKRAAKKSPGKILVPRDAIGSGRGAPKARSAGIDFAGTPSQPRLAGPNQSFTLVPVYFGTDRKPKETRNLVTFGNERDPNGNVWLGRCHVSVPETHAMGELESPKWYRLEFKPNPSKHLMLWDTAVLEANDFYRDLRGQVKSSSDRAAFVFIHGFNVSFEDAVRRTGQMAYDLKFAGAAILFSWPSRASVTKYLADEATITSSVKHIQDFLKAVISRTGAEVLHVIAHSMGNRALLLALQRLADSRQGTPIHNVILAAPDEDRQTFAQIAEEIQKVPRRITLYASSKDKALQASRKIHDAPRAGESGKNLIILPFMDTVDATKVDTDFLGHSFAMGDKFVLGDIFELLRRGTPPDKRVGLRKVAGAYWAF